jgi:AraC-like DNA-binding protein
MKPRDSALDFHRHLSTDDSEPGQFNVYRVEETRGSLPFPYNRRDFYKIALCSKGEGMLSYSDRTFHIKDGVIAFFNPLIPYSWDPISTSNSGLSCLFTEEFVNHHLKADSLAQSPLFKVNGNHVLVPSPSSMTFLTGIFERMITELQSAYVNKYDLLRSYIQIIMHEALKIEPLEKTPWSGNSSARISGLFMELLERQFPISSPSHVIQLKNAGEFAGQLAVHTNHLNRSLKETTGRTTSELITERLVKEARALLLHSNWDIAQIGYCLGFEHASNFNNFFKKLTAQTPNHFRKMGQDMACS